MTSANNALADIMMLHRKNDMTDNEVANCMNMIANCDKLLANVKREQDLDKKKGMLTELFNKIHACAYCKSFSYRMNNRISYLMTEFNEAVIEHNKHVDYARLDEENGQSTAGSRRRNKKSKNSKKKSRKSRKTKSRRH